jgi:hypothetical protein
MEEMKAEAAIMAQFSHSNVIGLIGLVNEGDMFLVIVQYCEHGSLLVWLGEQGFVFCIHLFVYMFTNNNTNDERIRYV